MSSAKAFGPQVREVPAPVPRSSPATSHAPSSDPQGNRVFQKMHWLLGRGDATAEGDRVGCGARYAWAGAREPVGNSSGVRWFLIRALLTDTDSKLNTQAMNNKSLGQISPEFVTPFPRAGLTCKMHVCEASTSPADNNVRNPRLHSFLLSSAACRLCYCFEADRAAGPSAASSMALRHVFEYPRSAGN